MCDRCVRHNYSFQFRLVPFDISLNCSTRPRLHVLYRGTVGLDNKDLNVSIPLSRTPKIVETNPVIPMKIIHNEDSNRKTATMVAMWNEERMFGNPAENTPTKYPSQVFWYLSQIVGKKYEVPAVDLYKRRFPYYNLVKDELRGTVLFKIDDLFAVQSLTGFV